MRGAKLKPFDAVKAYCETKGYPPPVPEHRFAPPRLFRFDMAFMAQKIALEVEGGIYGAGKPCPVCHRRPVAGHGSIERLKSDMEKYNLAAVMGWAVARCRPEEVESGAVFSLLDRLFPEGA